MQMYGLSPPCPCRCVIVRYSKIGEQDILSRLLVVAAKENVGGANWKIMGGICRPASLLVMHIVRDSVQQESMHLVLCHELGQNALKWLS